MDELLDTDLISPAHTGAEMALNTLESNTIARGCAIAKKILDDVKPVLDSLNVLFDTPTTGVKATVDQADLDSAPNLSGLTEAQLDAGFFQLTDTLRLAIANGYTQLAHIAARA